MAAEMVSRFTNHQNVQRAASLAKSGMAAAHQKVRTVSQQMQASYKVGRDKATSVTGRNGTRTDTEGRFLFIFKVHIFVVSINTSLCFVVSINTYFVL